jgi:AcrR family transcriptional regulator
VPTVLTTRAPKKRRPTTIAADGVPRRRGRPPRLSRPAILAKALELIDREGAEALTMRRLGSELGVEAMSLYRHVSSKQALLDGVAEQLIAEIDDCRENRGNGWAASALSLALAVRAVAQAHPAAFALVGARRLNTRGALRPIEALLAELRAAGFSPGRAVTIQRMMSAYIRGFALVEIAAFTLSGGSDPSRLSPNRLPADEFPTMRELADELEAAPTDDQFRAGFEAMLAGLRLELQPAAC